MRVKNTINLDQEVITSVCLVNVYWDTLTRTQVTFSSWKQCPGLVNVNWGTLTRAQVTSSSWETVPNKDEPMNRRLIGCHTSLTFFKKVLTI